MFFSVTNFFFSSWVAVFCSADRFKTGDVMVLVATDLAARGIDITVRRRVRIVLSGCFAVSRNSRGGRFRAFRRRRQCGMRWRRAMLTTHVYYNTRFLFAIVVDLNKILGGEGLQA